MGLRLLWLAGGILVALLGTLCYLVNPHSIASFGLTVINAALAVFAIRANPRRRLNRVFAAMSLSIALWGADLVFLHLAPDAETAGRWVGFARIGFLFIPAAIWHFAVELTGRRGRVWSSLVVGAYALSAMFALLSVTSHLGSGIVWKDFMYVPQANATYQAFILYMILAVPGSVLLVFVSTWIEPSARLRTQYKIFLVGVGISFLLAFPNLIAPLGFTGFRYGALGGIAFFAVFAFAIVRYRWLDLQFVIRKTLVYSLLTTGIAATYGLALLATSLVFQAGEPTSSFLSTAATICAVAFGFSPARDALQNLVDRLFYRASYDDRRLLQHLTGEMSAAMGIDAIARILLASLVDTMKLSSARLIVRVPPPDGEPVCHVYGLPQPRHNLPEYSMLLSVLESFPVILDPDDGSEFEPLLGTLDAETLLRARTWLQAERAGLVVPLVARERVLGALVIGRKRSELPFRSEEIQNLTTLANHAAVAIENSRLYEQVLAMRNYNEAILRSMDDGLVTLDVQGRVVTLNRAAETLLGRRSVDLVGRRYDEALAAFPPFVEFVREATLALRGLDRREVRLDERTFQLRSSPLEGESAGLLLMLEDVTEQRRIEQRREMERYMATMGEMAMQIAHEIRNPIGSISVWSKLLASKVEDVQFRNSYVETIHPEIERLQRLVEDLLHLASPMRLNRVPLRPSEIMDSALRLVAADLETSGIAVRRRYDERPPEILGDGERLKQIILNLLKNSIDAMAQSPRRELEVAVHGSDGSVELVVADTGSGMDPESVRRLFTPFFTTKPRGTGLGLAIVHRIVRDHGWTIHVASQPGEGSRFTIRCSAASPAGENGGCAASSATFEKGG